MKGILYGKFAVESFDQRIKWKSYAKNKRL
jgi:hypothetical protein